MAGRPAKSGPDHLRNSRQRARSVPYRSVYVYPVLVTALWILASLATVTVGVLTALSPTEERLQIFFSFAFCTFILWLASFFGRKKVFCCLCRGTPLVSSHALPHKSFRKYPMLSSGLSTCFSILLTQRYTCMYCGTPFDLLKKPTRLKAKEQ